MSDDTPNTHHHFSALAHEQEAVQPEHHAPPSSVVEPDIAEASLQATNQISGQISEQAPEPGAVNQPAVVASSVQCQTMDDASASPSESFPTAEPFPTSENLSPSPHLPSSQRMATPERLSFDENSIPAHAAATNTAIPVQRVPNDYFYAIGVLEVRFPNTGVEKQFLQVAMTLAVNEHDFYAVFSNQGSKSEPDKYFYLAEQVQWVLSIEKEMCYLVRPVSKGELEALIAAMKPPATLMDPIYTCVIGIQSPSDNNLALPEVATEHVFFQTITQLHKVIDPSEESTTGQAIQAVTKALEFHANKGRTAFDRAKNFLAYRYPGIYKHTHKMQTGSSDSVKSSLVSIEFSDFDGLSDHVIVEIAMTFQENSSTNRHYYFCRVDVTGLFPFINTEIQRFIPVTPIQDSFE